MSELIFTLVADFLLDKGWYRDGDDIGIWRTPARDDLSKFDMGYSLGEAIDIQLARDGVDAQTEAS